MKEKTPIKFEYPILSKQELHAMNGELDKYKTERDGIRYLSTEGESSYLKDKGALSSSNGVIIGVYELESNKLEQYHKWRRKISYAQKIESKELEKLADTLSINYQ